MAMEIRLVGLLLFLYITTDYSQAKLLWPKTSVKASKTFCPANKVAHAKPGNSTRVSSPQDCAAFCMEHDTCYGFNMITQSKKKMKFHLCELITEPYASCDIKRNRTSTYYDARNCEQPLREKKCCDTEPEVDCKRFVENGECTNNPVWMAWKCAESCQSSCACADESDSTRDHHCDCMYWAAAGECQVNYDWMHHNCHNACKLRDGGMQCSLLDLPRYNNTAYHVSDWRACTADHDVRVPYYINYFCKEGYINNDWPASGHQVCAKNGTWIRSEVEIGKPPNCQPDPYLAICTRPEFNPITGQGEEHRNTTQEGQEVDSNVVDSAKGGFDIWGNLTEEEILADKAAAEGVHENMKDIMNEQAEMTTIPANETSMPMTNLPQEKTTMSTTPPSS